MPFRGLADSILNRVDAENARRADLAQNITSSITQGIGSAITGIAAHNEKIERQTSPETLELIKQTKFGRDPEVKNLVSKIEELNKIKINDKSAFREADGRKQLGDLRKNLVKKVPGIDFLTQQLQREREDAKFGAQLGLQRQKAFLSSKKDRPDLLTKKQLIDDERKKVPDIDRSASTARAMLSDNVVDLIKQTGGDQDAAIAGDVATVLNTKFNKFNADVLVQPKQVLENQLVSAYNRIKNSPNKPEATKIMESMRLALDLKAVGEKGRAPEVFSSIIVKSIVEESGITAENFRTGEAGFKAWVNSLVPTVRKKLGEIEDVDFEQNAHKIGTEALDKVIDDLEESNSKFSVVGDFGTFDPKDAEENFVKTLTQRKTLGYNNTLLPDFAAPRDPERLETAFRLRGNDQGWQWILTYLRAKNIIKPFEIGENGVVSDQTFDKIKKNVSTKEVRQALGLDKKTKPLPSLARFGGQ